MFLSLDWLSFSLRKPDSNKPIKKIVNSTELVNILSHKDIEEMSDIDYFFDTFPEFENIKDELIILNGRSHYQNCIGFLGVNEYCRISYNNDGFTSVNMGVNVSIPSHGLEWFFDLLGFDINESYAVQQLFIELKNRGCYCTRIDLAFDDYLKTFRPKQYIRWYFDGYLRTKFKKIMTASSQQDIGHTFYLGDRKKRMLRIYDKDFESKGFIDAVRYEFELHQHHAKNMFEHIIEHANVDFVAYLRTYFDVIQNPDVVNKSTCNLLEDWACWLQNLDFSEELPQAITIRKVGFDERVSRAEYWFRHSVVPSIKGFVLSHGSDELFKLLREESRKIPDRYKSLIYEQSLDDDLLMYKYNF